jgi:tRNA pseudouridine65 synthase
MDNPRPFTPFEIIFEDEHLVAINKPWGILVHRTGISEDRVFVLQLLRDQLNGQLLYPVHRIDRATSGILVFSKEREIASILGTQFMERSVEKQYLAIVRGWTPTADTIDYPLADTENGRTEPLPSVTDYCTLAQSEIEAPIGLRYPTARFSLVRASPQTGRRHQIRKHFAHIRYPIIGDTRHGDVKQNKYFKDEWGFLRMLLHAAYMSFEHPLTHQKIALRASLDEDFQEGLRLTQLHDFTPTDLIKQPILDV